MPVIECPDCLTHIPESEPVCPHCGFQFRTPSLEVSAPLRPPDASICTVCGRIGSEIKQQQGSCLIELVLYLFFILPGIIYSVWRFGSRDRRVCKYCNGKTIPCSSPQGLHLWKTLSKK